MEELSVKALVPSKGLQYTKFQMFKLNLPGNKRTDEKQEQGARSVWWLHPVLCQLTPHLLLYLVAAVCTGEAHNHLQLLSCIVYKLLLKRSLFRTGRPRQPLIKVQSSVHT